MLSFVPHQPDITGLISPSEAIALVWRALPSESGDAERHYDATKRVLFSALRDGEVGACVHLLATGSFYRVPVGYWKAGDFWDLRLSDRLSALFDSEVPSELEDGDLLLHRQEVDALLSVIGSAAPDADKSKDRGRSKPKWYPALVNEIQKQVQRMAAFEVAYPDKPLPVFPSATRFKEKLAQLGFPEDTLGGDRNFRNHVNNIKKLLGR